MEPPNSANWSNCSPNSLNSTLLTLNETDSNLNTTSQLFPESYLVLSTQLQLISGGFGVLIVGSLGSILNILSIIIFLQPGMRSSINILLIFLQISDLIVVSTTFFIGGLPIVLNNYGYQVQDKESIFMLSAEYVYAFFSLGKFGSHYFTIAISLERYIAVCHPFRARSLCTQGRSLLASIILALLSLIFSLPRWIQVKWVHAKAFLFFEVSVIQFAPFVVLPLLNIAIYIGYRRSQRALKILGFCSRDNSTESNSITLVLMSIVVAFLFCNSFYALFYLHIILGLAPNWFMLLVIRPHADLLVSVNSACNFIFYCAFGKKFRRELGKVLRFRFIQETLVQSSGSGSGSTRSRRSSRSKVTLMRKRPDHN